MGEKIILDKMTNISLKQKIEDALGHHERFWMGPEVTLSRNTWLIILTVILAISVILGVYVFLRVRRYKEDQE